MAAAMAAAAPSSSSSSSSSMLARSARAAHCSCQCSWRTVLHPQQPWLAAPAAPRPPQPPPLLRPPQPQQQPQRRRRRLCVAAASSQDGGRPDDLDVAVFRFTLGIPGFDDANIPRVVGAGVAALVVLNHVLGAQPAPPVQVRAEFLDVTLAVLCFTAPELEARLRSAAAGRGRAGAGQVAGAGQLFGLAEQLPDVARKELAWASFALLKNVNCCSVLLLQPGGAAPVLLARGAVSQSVLAGGGSAADGLARIAQGLGSSMPAPPPGGQQWLPDRSAMRAAGLAGCSFVPEGAQSALLQGVPGGGTLLVLGERPNALSDKDQKWVAAIASKLGGVLQQQA